MTRCEPRTLVSAAKILSRVSAALGQELGGGRAPGLGRDRDEEMLGADVLVLQPVGFGLRRGRRPACSRGDSPGCDAAVRLRDLREQLARAAADLRRIGGHLPQHLGHDALALLDERDEQMLGLDLRVAHLLGELLRGERRLPGLSRCTC